MPCTPSCPLISPTTLLVAGSMIWMESPPKLLCRILSFEACCAAGSVRDNVPATRPARITRPLCNRCFLFIFVILPCDDNCLLTITNALSVSHKRPPNRQVQRPLLSKLQNQLG